MLVDNEELEKTIYQDEQNPEQLEMSESRDFQLAIEELEKTSNQVEQNPEQIEMSASANFQNATLMTLDEFKEIDPASYKFIYEASDQQDNEKEIDQNNVEKNSIFSINSVFGDIAEDNLNSIDVYDKALQVVKFCNG